MNLVLYSMCAMCIRCSNRVTVWPRPLGVVITWIHCTVHPICGTLSFDYSGIERVAVKCRVELDGG